MAEEIGIDVEVFDKTLQCESEYRWDAVGDKGASIGVAQLRYPTRDWGISTSSALDPYKNIMVAAKAFKNGLAKKWTCYRDLKDI